MEANALRLPNGYGTKTVFRWQLIPYQKKQCLDKSALKEKDDSFLFLDVLKR